MGPPPGTESPMTVVVAGTGVDTVPAEIDTDDWDGIELVEVPEEDTGWTVPEIPDGDLHLAMDEAGLLEFVRAGTDSPVLPVSVDGICSVSRLDLNAALRAVWDGNYTSRPVPTLDVAVDGDEYRALMDVMVVTAEAAKISEYALRTERRGQSDVLDTVRADGMVAATPTGTPGYASASGGPLLDPDLEVITVVPVGPFRVEQPHWVLDLPVEIRVVREEVPVSLLVDDREVGMVDAGTGVKLSWGAPVDVVDTPVSTSPLSGVSEWAADDVPDGSA